MEDEEQGSNKCSKCLKRVAKDGCTQSSCLACCTDDDGCEAHRKPRAQLVWKTQVLSGTTEVQQLASTLRQKKIHNKLFREPGFVYQGDTVVLWDIRTYARNEQWREDALRKSNRRNKIHVRPQGLRNSRKRFYRLIQEWHDNNPK